jgi:chemotaxis protein MotA
MSKSLLDGRKIRGQEPMTRAMKAATAIGIVAAIVGILGGAMMEGTSPTAFLNMPAMILVFVGTFGATLAACGMDPMKKIPAYYKIAFAGAEHHLAAKVHELVAFAEKARKDGLLALESDLEEIDNAFTKKGMQLVVDGTDPDLVREILEVEVDAMAARHKEGVEVFKTAGGFAPTMGIIGTVMGLVHVLQHLSAPETLGPSISGAFIATLMGVGAANVVFLPIAARLKGLSHQELHERNLVLEGILSIQSGDNPRVVSEKLMSLVPPAERLSAEEAAKPNLRLADAAPAADAAEKAA